MFLELYTKFMRFVEGRSQMNLDVYKKTLHFGYEKASFDCLCFFFIAVHNPGAQIFHYPCVVIKWIKVLTLHPRVPSSYSYEEFPRHSVTLTMLFTRGLWQAQILPYFCYEGSQPGMEFLNFLEKGLALLC